MYKLSWIKYLPVPGIELLCSMKSGFETHKQLIYDY